MKLLALLTISMFILCLPVAAQKTNRAAKVLAVELLHYKSGQETVHCSSDGKGGVDCNVTPASQGSILVASPGYVSSAYIELGLPDHRIVSLACDPGNWSWSKRFCTAPEKDQVVQVDFKGKHAIVRWDVKIQRILSVDKTEIKVEHRSETYEITGVAENRYFGDVSSPPQPSREKR